MQKQCLLIGIHFVTKYVINSLQTRDENVAYLPCVRDVLAVQPQRVRVGFATDSLRARTAPQPLSNRYYDNSLTLLSNKTPDLAADDSPFLRSFDIEQKSFDQMCCARQ
ncbi:unnamed protein product [Euphydryas editha]|uniref:Uncharacterized protein n=1 Tax=Euphydryas editha TaxID=104508 RepID=A0AAU9TX97_EUPED|nr:unnamed protein product [Euphydryas editha]